MTDTDLSELDLPELNRRREELWTDLNRAEDLLYHVERVNNHAAMVAKLAPDLYDDVPDTFPVVDASDAVGAVKQERDTINEKHNAVDEELYSRREDAE